MEIITWQVAFTIIGGLITILTFLYGILKKENPEKKDKKEIHSSDDCIRLNNLELKVQYIEKEIETIKTHVKENKDHFSNEISNIGKSMKDLLDKFIDLLKRN